MFWGDDLEKILVDYIIDDSGENLNKNINLFLEYTLDFSIKIEVLNSLSDKGILLKNKDIVKNIIKTLNYKNIIYILENINKNHENKSNSKEEISFINNIIVEVIKENFSDFKDLSKTDFTKIFELIGDINIINKYLDDNIKSKLLKKFKKEYELN